MNKKDFSVSKEFANPSSMYRGKPFWAWNGKLEEAELRRQIDIMKEMGLGGAFMHSRTGLSTEYLSEEWFNLINACAEQCGKNSMEAWLYDEDRWPSGAAGGIVTKNPKYRMKSLQIAVIPKQEYKFSKEDFAIFAAEIDGDELKSYRRISKKELGKFDESKIISCKIKVQEPSSWYNGQSYLDTMSEEAVDKFIEVTHKEYKNKCKKNKKLIPGIFTDEPYYGKFRTSQNTSNIPWTDKILAVFKKKYGYDLIDFLPEITFRYRGDDFSKVRHDYFETITMLFVDTFGKKIYDFCEKAGLLFTGHVLGEETLSSQTNVVGSAMRFYEYMQAPGIDILCAQGLERQGGKEKELEYLTAKQCQSVLNQMGRKWMLSELYGCTGWHFTLSEHKAVGDWQAALGVNLRCQHLSWYTMKGEAKRDYPASIFFQSPFWRDYNLVEDYFARLSFMLTKGSSLIDVGVIHPIESAWSLAYQNLNLSGYGFPQRDSDGKMSPLHQLDRKLSTLQKILLEEHYDFEYIDEDIFSRHGSVSNGRMQVGKSSYSTVIVPFTSTLRKTTAKALAKFAKTGGNVIFVDSLPSRIDAEESDLIQRLFTNPTTVSLDRTQLLDKIKKDNSIRRVSIKDSSGKEFSKSLYMMRHKKDGELIVFVCSMFQDAPSVQIELEIPFNGQAQEWDPQSGEVFLADFLQTKSGIKIKTSLEGCGSRLFVISPETKNSLVRREKLIEIKKIAFSDKEFKILRDEPNAFPLDYAEFSINCGEFDKRTEILKIDTIVRKNAGWCAQGGNMAQPWTWEKEKNPKKIPVSLRYKFIVDEIPKVNSYLVVESPERFRMKLNDFDLYYDGLEGAWIDNSFKKIKVSSSLLKVGENLIELSIDYLKEDALEVIYFIGEFGVEWRKNPEGGAPLPVISALPDKLKLGDWCEQGFPAYTGSIAYLAELELNELDSKFFLEIPEWAGSLLRVFVNGKNAGKIAWKPFEIEISSLLQKGKNQITIEVVGTRKNILGPLHNKNKYPVWTGPWEFRDEKNWTDDYIRHPYGIFSAPFISLRKKVK